MMRRSTVGCAVMLMAAEAAALGLAAVWPIVGPGFGPIHAGCALAMLVLVRRGGPAAAGSTSTWVACALGPAGVLVASTAQTLLRGRRIILPLAGAPGETVERERVTLSATRILDDRLRHCDADHLGSLTRVFRRGTIADRQAAIETVVSRFEPRLSPIIALALADRDQTIRALAASASAQIAQRLARRRARLETAVATAGTTADQLALADLLAGHGRHDVLLSDTQRGRMRDQARAAYQAVLAGLPADDDARPGVADRLRALDPAAEDAATDPAPLRAACDALFRARDFAGLARRCAMPDAVALRADDPLHAAVAFWRGASPA